MTWDVRERPNKDPSSRNFEKNYLDVCLNQQITVCMCELSAIEKRSCTDLKMNSPFRIEG